MRLQTRQVARGRAKDVKMELRPLATRCQHVDELWGWGTPVMASTVGQLKQTPHGGSRNCHRPAGRAGVAVLETVPGGAGAGGPGSSICSQAPSERRGQAIVGYPNRSGVSGTSLRRQIRRQMRAKPVFER